MNALIDNYLWLRHLKHRAPIHVRLMDLEVAMARLSRKLRDAVVVYGLLRFESRAAGEALHISHMAVTKRYRQAVAEIVFLLNGEE